MFHQGNLYAYGPYTREINLWGKYVDELTVVAPLSKKNVSAIDLPYNHSNTRLKQIPSISLTSFSQIIKSIVFAPVIFFKITNEMSKADHIHLRCPGNIGLIGCIAQIFFCKKIKTAKYAGNWDPQAKQPISYRLQKWMLRNTSLTKNMRVLEYGQWNEQTKNIKSFFTATYPKSKVRQAKSSEFGLNYKFLFVGSLSPGKRPLYAVQVIEALYKKGVSCSLELYGDGVQRGLLENYIELHNLSKIIKLHGNQSAEKVENAYLKSQFLILPSKSEGWPKVVAEAMFWGCIPIATKISCVPWMLGNGQRGLLIEMDLDRDVNKVLYLLSQQEKIRDITNNAQNWSQKYTLDSFDDEIKKLLK